MAVITAKQNFMETCLDQLARKLNQDLVKMEKMSGEREDFQPIVEKMVAGVIVKLHETIIEAFPKSAIIFQNTTPYQPEETDGSKFMIIPMGGLKNLNHCHEEAFIAMAFVDRNDVMHEAVVYNPFTEETFAVARNSGAFSKERRLRVSNRKKSCDFVVYSNKKLAEAKDFDKAIDLSIEQIKTNQVLKTTDASLLGLMYVLSAKKDTFIATGLTEHEALIAKLFAKESGAIATGFKAEEITSKTTSIVVSNSKLHASLLGKLK